MKFITQHFFCAHLKMKICYRFTTLMDLGEP